MSCAPVVGWGGAVREGRVLQAEGSSHVLLPELTAGAGARTKGAPRCAGRVAGVPTRPATPNRRHAFRRFPRCHWSVPWFGWGLKERHLVSRAATRLDWAGDALALRTQLRSSVTADSASAGHPHPTGTPSPSSFLSSGSFFLELYASGGCNKMEPYCWTGRGTPAGSHDDDGCGMGNGSGLSGESLRTSMYSASPPLHGAVGPCPRRLLPPTFELPVGPPPAPTIDAEMHDADDWPGLRWSTCHPEGERLADMLSSPTAWAAGMDKAANQMMSTLQSLPPLISPPPGLWTASAPGAIVPPPPPPRRRPALLAAMEEAAELLMQRFELRASGDTGGLPPPLGSVDVPRFVVTEDGSSSDRRAPTSPTAVWGFFEDDSDVCSSERTRGVGGVKLNSGLAVSRRVLTPSPSTSGALVMNVDVNAKSMGVTKLPARPKTVRSKNTTAGAASRNVPSPVTMALPVRATLSSTVPGAAAPPPPRKRKKATFVSPVPSRFCHLCSRTAPAVRHVVCGALAASATCRKVVCDRCFWAAGPVGLGGHTFDTAVAAGNTWRCSHCVGNCPARAQCRNYTRTNERLRLARSATMGELAAGACGEGEAVGRLPAGIHRRAGSKVAAAELCDSPAPKAKRSRSRSYKEASFNVLMPQEPTTDAAVATSRQIGGIHKIGATAAVTEEETGRFMLVNARPPPTGGVGPARTNRPRLPVSRRLF